MDENKLVHVVSNSRGYLRIRGDVNGEVFDQVVQRVSPIQVEVTLASAPCQQDLYEMLKRVATNPIVVGMSAHIRDELHRENPDLSEYDCDLVRAAQRLVEEVEEFRR